MFKKGIIMIIIFLFVSGISVFGNEKEYVNIINPILGESGKLISDNSLFISIFVIEDVDLTLELIKDNTPVFNFETSEENCDLISGFRSIEVIEKPLTKSEISNLYNKSEKKYNYLEEEYLRVKLVVEKIPSLLDENDESYSTLMSDKDRNNVKYFDLISEKYNVAKEEYYFWKEEYLKLFEDIIIDNIKIEVDPFLPYFEHTVKNIEEGEYKLMIKLESTGEIVEMMEFKVLTEDTLIDEISDGFDIIDFFGPIKSNLIK